MLKDVRDDNVKKYRNKMKYMQAKAVMHDGMRNKEQHEGKGKGWACNNHNMTNPIIKDVGKCIN